MAILNEIFNHGGEKNGILIDGVKVDKKNELKNELSNAVAHGVIDVEDDNEAEEKATLIAGILLNAQQKVGKDQPAGKTPSKFFKKEK